LEHCEICEGALVLKDLGQLVSFPVKSDTENVLEMLYVRFIVCERTEKVSADKNHVGGSQASVLVG